MQVFPNGLGSTAGGDTLASCKPLYVSGNVWFVNSVTGVDGVSPRGKNREQPLATLYQATANAANGDIVVLMSGHKETIKDLSLSRTGIVVVGEGTSGGVPTVELTPDSTASNWGMLSIPNAVLRNIRFKAPASSMSNPTILINGHNGFTLDGCYFDCGATCQGDGVIVIQNGSCTGNPCDYLQIRNTTFVSTATTKTTLPKAAIYVSGAVAGAVFDGLVLDDGLYGFSSDTALWLSGGQFTYLRSYNASLLRGASKDISTSTGFSNVQTSTGGGRVVWT